MSRRASFGNANPPTPSAAPGIVVPRSLRRRRGHWMSAVTIFFNFRAFTGQSRLSTSSIGSSIVITNAERPGLARSCLCPRPTQPRACTSRCSVGASLALTIRLDCSTSSLLWTGRSKTWLGRHDEEGSRWIASTSMEMSTMSLSDMTPPGTGSFQLTPKSNRLMDPVAENPTRIPS